MYYESDTEAQEAHVTVVGMEFNPGAEANVDIERLLGFESESFGGKAHRRIGDHNQPLQWEESPDYCGDEALCFEILDKQGVVPFLLETVDHANRSKKTPFVQKYTAVFEFGDTLYGTMPIESESHSIACVVWFVLSKVSQS